MAVTIEVPADATKHAWAAKGTKCLGTLHRTNDGADRLSERMGGRIVVQCEACGRRLSLPTTKE